MKALEIVVGAQYGSEAKGHVTTRLLDYREAARRQRNDTAYPLVNVRVAGPNAGHTAYAVTGTKYALRQVPVGATREYPVVVMIAAGSEIDPEVLFNELDLLEADGLLANKTIYIDPNATILTDFHKRDEEQAKLVEEIGSTGKGIGAARAARAMRMAKRLADDPKLIGKLRTKRNVNVSPYWPNGNDHVVIEGTQGYGLGLHGRHYPQCTSSDCTAVDFAAMARISPWAARSVTVWAVARMFPIRVAGNSGPMKSETTWEALGLPPEYTTVTKKVRRVGLWDQDIVRDAVYANGGGDYVRLALTMVDQRWPELAGLTNYSQVYDQIMNGSPKETKFHIPFMEFISAVQSNAGARVGMVTTGPETGMIW